MAADVRRVGVLFDEAPIAPMRVESDILAEILKQIAKQETFRLDLLAPSEDGVVTRDGKKIDLKVFDALVVYQGDSIAQDTPLFADAVAEQLKRYIRSERRGLILLGGAAPLMEKIEFGVAYNFVPATFGEDRAQDGVAPINPTADIFDGVDLDRGIAWLTNAAFPAFQSFTIDGATISTLGVAPQGAGNDPLLVGVNYDCGRVQSKAYIFAHRVSPLYDSAPETYKNNFKTLISNMIKQVGKFLDPDDLRALLYTEPDFAAIERAVAYYEEELSVGYERISFFREKLRDLKNRSIIVKNLIASDLGSNHRVDYSDELGVVQEQLDDMIGDIYDDFATLQRNVLLCSPELDFDSFLFVRRDPALMGLPENYNSNSSIPAVGYRDELCRYNIRTGETKTVYKPEHGEFVGDLELYYDASKVMFSSPDVNANDRWRLWELPLNEDGSAAGQPKIVEMAADLPDVDNYDGSYLPDDRIVFCSTAPMTGVPCINGSGHVCNLYLREHDGSVRQLTIEQDHDWNPVVMNNGRVMYLRWEYVDLPHCFSRILFHMNPDGTNQSELYGSGSYWPNSIFYARPLPGASTKFVGVVTGHHELNRVGDLVVFDPSLGRKEAEGAVQRIPGYGKKVEPIACDLPIAQDWPKFLHPYPISDTLFIVSCKRSAESPWEICLVDTFDNIATLVSEDGNAALEPIPLRETERQPIVADRVDLDSTTADVFIADIYEGEGLKGVPRGEVKSLRVFSYQFAYQGMGAEPYSVGLDGPWDPRRIIGTVPVAEDGSASFKIPAYVPIALQPLDKDGKAIQIMRSWITAMPGESVSCIGCHESQNSTGTTDPRGVASRSTPAEIAPFHGPTRGFGFESEIQPILDRYCVECHHSHAASDKNVKRPNETFELQGMPDFTQSAPKPALENGSYIAEKSPISNSYYQLRRFVRTVTKESQMETHRPYDFHADSTLLVQILQNYHTVELDPVSWEKLYTWIDLNAPYNGSWGEMIRDDPALVKSQYARREELRKLYAPGSEQLDDDPNAPTPAQAVEETDLRVRFKSEYTTDPEVAKSVDVDKIKTERVDLGDGVRLELRNLRGTGLSVGRFEITNEQYKLFDPTFNAGIEYGDFIQFSPGERGWLLSRKKQPVVRVSYKDAEAFCAWLTEKTGNTYRLPTLAEWKLFAQAEQDFAFGDAAADYGKYENLADSTHALISPFGWTGRVDTLPAWRPVDWDVNDHSRVSAPVGSYLPNKLGLFDVQGNVGEWTSTERVDTRSVVDIAKNEVVSESKTTKKVVAGGSWLLPARYAGKDALRAFPEYYDLRDVGFRVVRLDAK